MAKAPVSVCIITRDDPHLDAAIASIAPWVEEVCVLITTDVDVSSYEIGQKHGAKSSFSTKCNGEDGRITDFSVARNKALAMATQPWVMWMDSDDVIAGADKLVDLCKAPPGTCYVFPYEYAYDELGRVVTRQYRERLIHGKERMEWRYPVHEVLCAKQPGQVTFVQCDDVVFKHQRQWHQHKKQVEPQRNLRILKDWMAKNPDDVRNMYYIGLEYSNCGQPNEAIEWLQKYIERTGWDDERAMACYQLVRIFEAQKNPKEGLRAAFEALKTTDWFESHYAICRMFYLMGNWERCAYYGKLALERPKTQTPLFINEADRHEIHAYLNVALNQLGRVEEAWESCKAGLQGNPKHPTLSHNRELYERAFSVGHGRTEGRRDLADAPGRSGGSSSGGTGPLNIAFATWLGCEQWDPETWKKTGLGGSETMLIHMARELAALGHKVTVYADPPREGVHDGVTYKSVRGFRDVACDVCVVSRYAQLLDEREFPVRAQVRLLWCHDIFAHGGKERPDLVSRADRVLALSQWHKQSLLEHHPQLDPAKIWVTRNGIDLARFKLRHVGRDALRVVNSSSPDRSWPVLIEEWPRIRKEVPDAELHLFYGFENWLAMGGNEYAIRSLEHKARDAGGVVVHGRVNQEQLAQEFLKSGVWAHPTWFTETSCITAMEAKAAGLHIVTSNLAALKETARGGVLIDGDWQDAHYRLRFVDEVVKALNSGPHGPWPDVEGFDIKSLAKDWESMFRQLLAPAVLEPYEPTAAYRNDSGGGKTPSPKASPAGIPQRAGTNLVKLNIACGPNIFPYPGWVNYDLDTQDQYFAYLRNYSTPLDGMPEPQRQLAAWLRENNRLGTITKHDMTKPFTQHADGSVDFIYCGQAIEHLNPIYEAPAFLKECHRMLKPGGVLRMTTPDGLLIINASEHKLRDKFAADQPEWFRTAHPEAQRAYLLFGACGPNCTRTNYEGHMMVYTRESLGGALVEAKFVSWTFKPPARPEIRDEGMSHSLCVEATK